MNKRQLYSLKADTKRHSDNLDFVSKYISAEDSFLFAIQKSNSFSWIEGDISEFTENIYDLLAENIDKEKMYVQAIKNLIKQKEYLTLMYEYSNGMISDEEFSQELDVNEYKYLIRVDGELNSKSCQILSKVVRNLGQNFTDDDLSEIFSIRTNNIIEVIGGVKPKEIDESGSY